MTFLHFSIARPGTGDLPQKASSSVLCLRAAKVQSREFSYKCTSAFLRGLPATPLVRSFLEGSYSTLGRDGPGGGPPRVKSLQQVSQIPKP